MIKTAWIFFLRECSKSCVRELCPRFSHFACQVRQKSQEGHGRSWQVEVNPPAIFGPSGTAVVDPPVLGELEGNFLCHGYRGGGDFSGHTPPATVVTQNGIARVDPENSSSSNWTLVTR